METHSLKLVDSVMTLLSEREMQSVVYKAGWNILLTGILSYMSVKMHNKLGINGSIWFLCLHIIWPILVVKSKKGFVALAAI